ncbi:PBSX family phage terminase large subunit [Candidatus Tokpelaia sp.]|uniref:PBSX family phage terminase large subunit n=1 Tax=Candidatus Tokpelaia sp. TaxID=2233777 RepID=UPI001FED67D0|nr:phage terminase large subunit [Candidatus Tokpelaia sp.]
MTKPVKMDSACANGQERVLRGLQKSTGGAVVQVELPPKLVPVFIGPARYRGAYGGRGSGKSRSFAVMAAIRGYLLAQAGKSGLIICGREFMNSLEDSSMAELRQAIAATPWLAGYYSMGENYVRTKDGRIAFAFIGLRHNLDSIKSKAHIHLLWIDEAERVSEAAWQKIIPTVRERDSEIWVTWNPESRASATHKRFREAKPHEAKIVALNWRDNPWFPSVLDKERQADLRDRPESYAHIWEGDFATYISGAYYAAGLTLAREERRIGAVAADPLMACQAFWDIGGTGARSDATAIWVAQFIGKEIRIIDYYEAQGQPLEAHISWLRGRGYERARMVLPHDGSTRDRVHDVSFESALRQAGFEVEIIPNQGAGAARLRIEAARRLLPQMWFDARKTAAGLNALAAYHEKRDENRNLGLGPEHDWASHAADAFGLMCVAYEEPVAAKRGRDERRPISGGSWMSG